MRIAHRGRPASLVIAAIALASLARLAYVAFVPLTPQEAYYWCYAQHPALSYFDHPPLTAWSIRLGTSVLGDTVLGVKAVAVIWATLTNILLYVTVRRAAPADEGTASRVALFAVLLYNAAPFAYVYALLMVPDSPLLFAWLLVVFFFQEIIVTGRRSAWIGLGLALGLALLAKYTAIALVPALAFVLIVRPELRRWLRRPEPYLALAIAAAVFSPVIVWNLRHEWASFAFQFAGRASRARGVRAKYLLQLVVTQFLLLSPLVFVLLAGLLPRLRRIWHGPATLFSMVASGAFLVGGFALIGLRSLVKMNWLLPAYSGPIMAVALLAAARPRTRWFRVGAAISIGLVAAFHAAILVPDLPIGEANTWSGWREAAPQILRLQAARGGPGKCFLFANSYKSASLLRFHLPDHQFTYAENVFGRPALQYDVWGLPASLRGKDAIYVVTDRREYDVDLEAVRRCFDTVEPLESFETRFAGRMPVRRITCYLARNYRGAPSTSTSGLVSRMVGPGPSTSRNVSPVSSESLLAACSCVSRYLLPGPARNEAASSAVRSAGRVLPR